MKSKTDLPKICHISSVHLASDTRVFYKECQSLALAGYDVTLIAKQGNAKLCNSVNVVNFPHFSNRFFRVILAPFLMLYFAFKNNSQVYHLHDPELMITGLLLKMFGKRVVYDCHEDVRVQILNKQWLGRRTIRKLAARLYGMAETFCSFFFDRIVVATPTIGKRFRPNKTVIIRNFPLLRLIDSAPLISRTSNSPIIIYAGGLARVRGIKQLVEAMSFVTTGAELWLLGPWESPALREECRALPGWNRCRDLGFQPLSVVYSYMKLAHVGIVPLLPVKNYLDSLPVKAFEYMACSLPMVLSNFDYWQRIYNGFGTFADPDHPQSLAGAINALLANPELRQRMGKSGRQKVEEDWSWECESQKLVSLYGQLSDYELASKEQLKCKIWVK